MNLVFIIIIIFKYVINIPLICGLNRADLVDALGANAPPQIF